MFEWISHQAKVDVRSNRYRLAVVPIGSIFLVFLSSVVLGIIVGDAKLADRLTLYPTYLLPSTLGLLCGFCIHSFARSIVDFLVWPIPLAVFIYCGISYAHDPYVASAWHTLIGAPGPDCGECLNTLLVNVPLFFSIAFSVGSLFGQRFKLRYG